jgi:hypothetical protein
MSTQPQTGDVNSLEKTAFDLANELMQKDAVDGVQASNNRIVVAKSHADTTETPTRQLTETQADAFRNAITDVLGDTMWQNERVDSAGETPDDPELGLSVITRTNNKLIQGHSESQATFVK